MTALDLSPASDVNVNGLTIERRFTASSGPFDGIVWTTRSSKIATPDGKSVFELAEVEVPDSWSQVATDIVASKYFRKAGVPQLDADGNPLHDEAGQPVLGPERSVRQVVLRLANAWMIWGQRAGMFATPADAEAFRDEMAYMIVRQMGAPNSPQWFNTGLFEAYGIVEDAEGNYYWDPVRGEAVESSHKHERSAASACYILSVDDVLVGDGSIMRHIEDAARLFKAGSGVGANYSRIREAGAPLTAGGQSSGLMSFLRVHDRAAGAIKCLHADTPLVTTRGVVPIKAVLPGDLVLTRFGFKRVSAVHDNGVRPVVNVTAVDGLDVTATPEHRFLVRSSHGETFKTAEELTGTDYLVFDTSGQAYGTLQRLDSEPVTHHNEVAHSLPETLTEDLGLWLGLNWGDGSVTFRPNAKFVALHVADSDPDLINRYTHLTRSIFGDSVHFFTSRRNDKADASLSLRFSASRVIRFLERNDLRKPAGDLRIPAKVSSSPPAVRAAFLSGLFETDGHVENGYVVLNSVYEHLIDDVQRELLALGIPSHKDVKVRRSGAFGTAPMWRVRVIGSEGMRRFAKLIGMVSDRKQAALLAAVERKEASRFETQWVLPHCVAECNRIWESGTQSLRRAIAPFCRYQKPRAMSLIAARRLLDAHPDELAGTEIEKFARGDRFYTTASVSECGFAPVFDLTVEDVHEYLVGSAVTHNSGGTTRRAARMVIVDADHPDIEEFIWCKVLEERKVAALVAAGYSSDFNGEAYDTVAFQNANHSVRVPAGFLDAVAADAEWPLISRKTGEAVKTVRAVELWEKIAEAAWQSADPGVQFDDLINDWNTVADTERVNGTNPCSEFTHVDNTSCNLGSLNLVSFWDDETTTFDTEAFEHAVRLWTIMLEITVSMSHYPTALVAKRSYEHRPLGLGYANLGALLMRAGLPYDSDQARAAMGALTALMHNRAYATSAEMAAALGPFPAYNENRSSMLRVLRNHRRATYGSLAARNNLGDYEQLSVRPQELDHIVLAHTPFHSLSDAAIAAADDMVAEALAHGVRNAQATVLAPTGCITPDSLITTNYGVLRLDTLGNVDGAQWQRPAIDGLTVLTDEGEQDVAQFFVNGFAEVAAVKTMQGRSLRGTPEHRIRVVDVETGEWQWRRLAEVREGDVVPVAASLVGAARTVVLPPAADMHWAGHDEFVGVPEKMTAGLAELAGYFQGDGSLHTSGLRLSVTGGDEATVKRLCELSRDELGIEPHRIEMHGCTSVEINSMRLARWWADIGLGKAGPDSLHFGDGHRQRVPDAVLGTNDPEIYGAFLRGLFEAAGTMGVAAAFSSPDREFVSTVQVLVTALGLLSSVSPGADAHSGEPVCTLDLWAGAYLPLFKERIGFMSARKNALLDERIGAALSPDRGDLVPVPDAVLDELFDVNSEAATRMREARWGRRGCLHARHLVQRLFDETGDPRLGQALSFFYDCVAADAELDGDAMTYDLSVPANVTYVANGFVSHNTIGLVMSCDTTGVEPDFALVKMKKLAGGGYMQIANGSVEPALRTLGYTDAQVQRILEWLLGSHTLEGGTIVCRGALVARGFTDVEVDRAAANISQVTDLTWAFGSHVVGDDVYERFDVPVEAGGQALLLAAGFAAADIEASSKAICGHLTVEGAPDLRPEHLPVFDCAVECGDGTRLIDWTGHVRALGAVAPFISGSVSKTVNMSNSASVQDILDAHNLAYQLGVKCVAVYRDGSKLSQPLNSAKSSDGSSLDEPAASTGPTLPVPQPGQSPTEFYDGHLPPRFRLPNMRDGKTWRFDIGGEEVYLRSGEYPDGSLGEIFLDWGKPGSTLRGMTAALSVTISQGLQHGVPLDKLVKSLRGMNFEPHGIVVGNDHLKMADSLIDAVVRILGHWYLGDRSLVQVPGEAPAVKAPAQPRPAAPTQADPPAEDTDKAAKVAAAAATGQKLFGQKCSNCQSERLVRNGSCKVCLDCAETTGCS